MIFLFGLVASPAPPAPLVWWGLRSGRPCSDAHAVPLAPGGLHGFVPARGDDLGGREEEDTMGGGGVGGPGPESIKAGMYMYVYRYTGRKKCIVR